MIGREVRHIIVVGNYVLLAEEPWSMLADLFDTTVMIEVSEDELRRRLTERWAHLQGTELAFKLDGNDLPNGRRVRTASRPAEFVIAQ